LFGEKKVTVLKKQQIMIAGLGWTGGVASERSFREGFCVETLPGSTHGPIIKYGEWKAKVSREEGFSNKEKKKSDGPKHLGWLFHKVTKITEKTKTHKVRIKANGLEGGNFWKKGT